MPAITTSAMMNIKSLVSIALISVSAAAFAQGNIPFLKKTPAAPDTSKDSYEKLLTDGFIGFGFVLGSSNPGATVSLGESREFVVGIGVGYKFVKWNGIGIDGYYKSTDFFLAQDSTKVLPNNQLHKSEKISFDNFGALAFDRFYIGKFFFDGGFYFDWTFYTKHIMWDTYSFSYGSTTKTIEKQLSFTNATNYGLTFRIGKTEGISLYFNYRLSTLFKSFTPSGTSTAVLYPELPTYVLGIVLAGH